MEVIETALLSHEGSLFLNMVKSYEFITVTKEAMDKRAR